MQYWQALQANIRLSPACASVLEVPELRVVQVSSGPTAPTNSSQRSAAGAGAAADTAAGLAKGGSYLSTLSLCVPFGLRPSILHT